MTVEKKAGEAADAIVDCGESNRTQSRVHGHHPQHLYAHELLTPQPLQSWALHDCWGGYGLGCGAVNKQGEASIDTSHYQHRSGFQAERSQIQ
jgi:hypothetical protein